MDNDECPDSTVLMDDDADVDNAVLDPFPHHIGGSRRSFDEPQSSRISSTGVHFGGSNYPLVPQLPPLPKLIFRPPTQAGLYPSVSFSSAGSASRQGSGMGGSSLSRAEQAASRLSGFPSSRSESFPGTRIGMNVQSRGEIPLPRMDGISRSELTISRVGSALPRGESSGARGGISSTSRNEIPVARVGGVSISRIEPHSSFSRIGGGSSSSLGGRGRIEMPSFARAGISKQLPPQLEVAAPSRKFGRRFLKATTPAKNQSQSVPRVSMTALRTNSTEEYFSSGQGNQANAEDPLSIANDSAMDFVNRRSIYSSASSSTNFSNATSTTVLGSGTLTSQQSSQGIKLHISKKPVEVIEVDDSSSEKSANSLSSSVQNNSDSNFGLPYEISSPPSESANNSSSSTSIDEVSVKPIIAHSSQSQLKERLKIPDDIVIEEAEEEIDDESKGVVGDSDEEIDTGSRSNNPPFVKILAIEDDVKKVEQINDSLRRTRRKRNLPVVANDVPQKVRRRRGVAAATATTPPAASGTDQELTPTSTTTVVTPTRGRGRGTGRGRGRPRGSTNKAKLERQLQTPQPQPEVKIEESPPVDTTVPEAPESLPLEGDPEVNAEISPAITTPVRKPRGRGRGSGTPRGTGSPRSARASRGARGSRSPSKKSPEAKKLKLEKKEKETIKVPLPVQVFDDETRMSADIKPPIPDKVTVALIPPVVLDEESRASNVSSTSTSTTAKAKRFTKDPIEERKPVTAETLYEYQWPLSDRNADFYFLQEQISEFLGVKSFKRKYPDIRRRVVDMEERDFLRGSKVVSETQCDLGLTAVHSCDVLDIMFNDFNEKYEEYRKVFQERKDQEMAKLKPDTEADTPAVRDRGAEFMRRIVKSCAKWNSAANRERMDDRLCAFDLQTGTLHYPKDKLRVLPPESTKIGHFPVAVLPGQFTDDYKKYTPDELCYLPLNSVRFGPICENWIVDSDSSDESSDSDDSSSSDDSSGSSSDDDGISEASEQNQVVFTDDFGNVIYRGQPGQTKVSTDATCKSCDGNGFRNKDGNPEVMLHCSRCDVANHITCLELSLDMLPFMTKYHWECTDCKNCIECNDPADEDKMLFCDCCDRGYHIYCVGLRKVPTGRWHCSVCSLCYSCGVTQPSPEDRMAEWHHEFRKGEKGSKFYLHSFCVACYKLFKKGQFCPSCLKVHTKFDDKGLLECRKCEKWVHKECVKRPLKSMFGFMCDPCDANFRSRSKLPSHVN